MRPIIIGHLFLIIVFQKKKIIIYQSVDD